MPHLIMIGGSDAGISAALRARELAPATEVTVLLQAARSLPELHAGHMLTDAGALGLAIWAQSLGARPRSDRKTFGYRRQEILAPIITVAHQRLS